MKLPFGLELRRTDTKAYSVRDLAKDVGYGFGAITPLDPWKVIAEAFAGNATVFAAVTKIGQAAGGIPWVAQAQAKDGTLKDLAGDHPLTRLVARPSPWHTWPQMVEALVGSLLLFGEGYVFLNGPGDPYKDQAPGRPPKEFLWLPTQWVEPIENDAGTGVAYYRVSTRTGDLRLPPHRVVAPKFWNPATPWRGQGRVRASAASIDTVNLGRQWNRNLLQKGARPPGILRTDQVLQPGVLERLELQRDRALGGAANAGKVPILENGLQWQSTGLTAADLDFTNGLMDAKRDIAVGFGVDPGALGDPQVKTYANYAEARLALYQDTVLPVVHLVRQSLESALQAWFPETCFYIEEDKVAALRAAKRQEWKGLSELVAAGLLTRNEARTEMGYDEVEGGDELLVPLALVPLRDAAAGGTGAGEPASKPPPGGEGGKDDANDAYTEG